VRPLFCGRQGGEEGGRLLSGRSLLPRRRLGSCRPALHVRSYVPYRMH
jgi:hypothetical protein